MSKDILYIDVEDDITAIIGKVKASRKDVVILVPPKRIGVLQSAVNLRLLERAAKQSNKKLALITSNAALIALAANAKIAVAKNLQAEPELATIPALAVDDEEEVIDGGKLPVGDHAVQAQSPESRARAARTALMAEAMADEAIAGDTPKRSVMKNNSKVPNFNSFRKKLVIGILLGIAFLGFLIWAIFFAPRATVVISANTSSASVNLPVTVSTGSRTDIKAATIKAITAEQSENVKQTFTATGQKDAGTKATGSVNFSNSSPSVRTVNAGTRLTSANGNTFIVTNDVSIPGATLSFSCQPNNLCPGKATGTVEAAENGSSYNADSGSLSGAPNGVSATFASPTSGGVSKIVTIVTVEDVQKAKQALVEGDTNSIRASLKSKFQEEAVAINESFVIDYGELSSVPAIGEEADKADLTGKVTYRLYGVAKSELKAFLKAYNDEQLDDDDSQRVYDEGADDAVFQEAKQIDRGATATLIATAQVGPRIEDGEVKALAKGKRYGEIQQSLESIQGVKSVDVRFFPFWVSSVPDDETRITVDFNLSK